MKVLKGLKAFKDTSGSVVTIGVFDGLHVGHRKVIERTISRARKTGMKSVILTFHPHPQKALNPESKVKSLISLDHRVRLIAQLGADTLIILNFTPTLAGLSAGKFLENILIKKLGAKEIFIGENFYFGKGARAGGRKLKEIARGFGVKVHIVKSVKKDGAVVSSSLIRHLITEGRITAARRLLGRRVSVYGTVIGGAGIARKLGYPTANINPHHEVVPPSGVYAVKALLGGKQFKGVLNIGTRPTFYGSRDKEPAIEAHLFDFHDAIYGKDIEILFIKKMRDEKKFKDERSLMAQIKRDARRARRIV